MYMSYINDEIVIPRFNLKPQGKIQILLSKMSEKIFQKCKVNNDVISE